MYKHPSTTLFTLTIDLNCFRNMGLKSDKLLIKLQSKKKKVMADVFQQYNKRNAPFLNDIRGHLSVDL